MGWTTRKEKEKGNVKGKPVKNEDNAPKMRRK
jgi:hypothetical protein